MGVVLWYQVAFPDLKIKISSDVYSGDYLDDAEISVSYGIDQPGKFQIRFKNLPLKVRGDLGDALGKKTGPDGGVQVTIRMGYLDDPLGQSAVLTGRVDTLQSTSRFPPLGSLLTGYEEASYKLVKKVDLSKEGITKPELAHVHLEQTNPAAVVEHILGQSKVKLVGEATPTTPTRDMTEDAENAFNLIETIAKKFGAELLVQDGEAQFGMAIKSPPTSGFASPPNIPAIIAFILSEDSLVAVKPAKSARLAEFKPFQLGSTGKHSVVTDLPKDADVGAFDFTVLGEPSLRAGQMVAAGVEGYTSGQYRILQVTHSFSPESGYVCTGRAVKFKDGGDNRAQSNLARRGGPDAVADRIAGKIKDIGASFPSVDVGKVKAVKAADRLATLFYEQKKSSDVGSPSVDLDVPDGDALLLDKPLASPFAWHKVGLSVPVYKGMRALLNEVRDLREDTVVTGFLWANKPQMHRPKAKDGDWWLCLPTEVSGDPPAPQGKGANDLIAADGRRVVEAVGLSVTVGKDKCSPVGERPTEGDPDVLLITHKTGTTIQIDANGNVTVDGQGQNVVLKCGGATLTIGNGKVAIS